MSVRIDAASPGQMRLRYGHATELLDPRGASRGTRLRFDNGALWMDRPQENQSSRLNPCDGAPTDGVAGRYRCAELDAELTVADTGGALYGAFSGFLGQGRMELLEPIGPDVWALPCPRALDHTPPGDWTLAFRRDSAGQVGGVELGCWLARRLSYARVSSYRPNP